MELKNYIYLTQGINSSRVSVSIDQLYDQQSFEKDYIQASLPNDHLYDEKNSDAYVKPGDVVINNMNQKAAIVSKENQGKLLTGNFYKAEFLTAQLDKSYFVYLYNENKEVIKEKNKQLQGTANVQKMTKTGLNLLNLPIVSLQLQQKIGQSYLRLQQLKQKMYLRMAYLDQLTLQVLEEKIILESERNNENG